jgi:hypothetical protein
MENVLDLESILAADDLQTAYVEVPEWKGTVKIRQLSADESLKFFETNKDPQHQKTSNLRLVMASAIKEDGSLLFTQDQFNNLAKKSMRAINRISDAALNLNAFTREKEKAVKND